MSRLLLSLENVGKVYPRTLKPGQRFSGFWQVLRRGQFDDGIRVLEGIDFEVRAGESFGIIGANGAGKSTLLKIITGVLAPSHGTIRREGTSAALLELGAGFDPEYTGMENLQMNAAFLGLNRAQVADKLDEILAFADIGEAIHEPVKHYSSGMVVRLGFAVVAVVKPDLLITDEVLAVGDESFQKKCIRWIERYLADGGTLLMVSHSMYQVQKLCRQALWLDAGKARLQGDVFDVTQSYLAWHERRSARQAEGEAQRRKDSASLYTVESVRLNEHEPGQGETLVQLGEQLRVDIGLRSPDGRAPVVSLGIIRVDGTPVYGLSNEQEDIVLKANDDGLYRTRLIFDRLALLPGGYIARAHALDPEGLRVHDTLEVPFTVRGRSRESGLVRLEHRWEQP
ncbi:MAG: ABC transporter ATP-binding protein [Wenzhouxiangella sp.]